MHIFNLKKKKYIIVFKTFFLFFFKFVKVIVKEKN